MTHIGSGFGPALATVGAVATALSLSACSQTGAQSGPGGEPASTADGALWSTLAGTTEYGTLPEGGGRYAYYRDETGAIRGQRTGDWGDDSDAGSWSVPETGVTCVTWGDWDDERRQCWRVSVGPGAVTFSAASGTNHSYEVRRDRLVKGNPERY